MHRSGLMAAIAAAALFLAAAPPQAQAQPQAQAIAPALARSLADKPGVPFAGRTDGDVTVIEYMDYNCPFCRKLAPELQKLMRADPKVRILYKDWPIFGGVSIYAAKVALAAAWQGKYLEAHDALIGAPARLESQQRVRELVKAAHIDLARLDRDLKVHGPQIEAELKRNNNEAVTLGLEGTPGLVVGSQLVFGGMPEAQLAALVAQARRRR